MKRWLLIILLVAAGNTAFAESPRDMLIQFRFGLYRPDIDKEFSNGMHPYKDIFGSGQHLMFQTELGYEVFNGFGTVLIAPGLGYFTVSGHGLLKDGQPADDSTSFSILPLYLDIQYRFDWFWHKFSVPLIPVVRGGLDYYLWWTKNGAGDVSTYSKGVGKEYKGQGGTFGGHIGFGLDFALDWLAPGMAQDFDSDWGVNTTTLFVEYTLNFINDFGRSKSFNLSSKSLFFGIAFEF